MPEQRKLEKWKIFCKSWKRWSVSCYTDWLLANQVAEKPVGISYLIIKTSINQLQKQIKDDIGVQTQASWEKFLQLY